MKPIRHFSIFSVSHKRLESNTHIFLLKMSEKKISLREYLNKREEELPPLDFDQVDYEPSPIQSPQENINSPKDSKENLNSPKEKIPEENILSENNVTGKDPGELSPLRSPAYSCSDEGDNSRPKYTSVWPWWEQVSHYDKYVNFAGSESQPNYGDARSFHEVDSLAFPLVTIPKERMKKSKFFQVLFWKIRHFEQKRFPKNGNALNISWKAFRDNYNTDPVSWFKKLKSKEEKFRKNSRSLRSLTYDIHCRTVIENGIPCGVRSTKCVYCPLNQKAMTDNELNYTLSNDELSNETRDLIHGLEKFVSKLNHESSRTHGQHQEYPVRGYSEAPKSSKRKGSQANVPRTQGSGYRNEKSSVDDRQGTQLSTAYSPDYQSEGREEEEEYDPASPSFSPSKAWRHKASKQKATASVSSQSISQSIAPPAETASQLDKFQQLRMELLEEKYLRSQLQNQLLELKADNTQMNVETHQIKKTLADMQQKFAVLEKDYRRSLGLLQHQGVLKGESLLRRKRKTDDTSSDAPHKKSDADAST
jgi:hypothetical protein